MPERVRRAYICAHKSHEIPPRRFIGERDPVPVCGDGHGKMIKQRNVPYVRPAADAELTTIGKRVDPPRRRPARPRG